MEIEPSPNEVSKGHGQYHEGIEQGDPRGAVGLAGDVRDVGVA